MIRVKERNTKDAADAVALVKKHGSISGAAKASGIPRQTLQDRLKFAKRNGMDVEKVQAPVMPDDDIPLDTLVEQMCERFKKRDTAYSAKKWMPFKIKTNEPMAICWFGDPHVDDNGCNWPLLKKDCEIVASTPGMYGANIGDSHNNWVGRLGALYANQDTSKDTAYKLVEWLFKHSGVDWLLMLMGNHDAWNDGSRMLKSIAQNLCPMVDWRAQFKLVFPNGKEVFIDAAHDHSGHSMWNPLHGQIKASEKGGIANLYIAGHRHNWALMQNESEGGRVYWLARARGYKHIDDYSDNLGFSNQKSGSSIVTVIDPKAASPTGVLRCFADVQEGADYLTYLRRDK